MSKYFHVGLVILYILITAFAFIVMLELSGVHISNACGLTLIACWGLLCYAAAYFSTWFFLFYHSRTRKPVLTEEEKLNRCFRELLQKTNCNKRFNLLIDEIMEINAFVIGARTIAVSRGSLERLTEGELKGLMAHELGHLLSNDSLISTTFLMSAQLPRFVKLVLITARRILAGRSGFRLKHWNVLKTIVFLIRNWFGLLLCLFGLYILVNLPKAIHYIMAGFAVCAFILIFTALDELFGKLHLIISRFTEYKQDAFAHALGYGTELREVLHKSTLEGPQPVNRFFILKHCTHPVIYNRIRRLEQLEGLR